MKKFFLLSLSVVALMPVVAGTAVPASSSTTVAQSTDLSPALIDALKAQAGSTLSRPL
ncbi:hypothetical protein ACFPN2_08635 [Steroidobacter flavus]|uniref:Uncharacterized protein n=1 Tax=Steroidobacter flavus TaxID=1842136 RepID=A0ABV8SRE8_9GAMM